MINFRGLVLGVVGVLAIGVLGGCAYDPCYFGCGSISTLRTIKWLTVHEYTEDKAKKECKKLTGKNARHCAFYIVPKRECHIIFTKGRADEYVVWREYKHCQNWYFYDAPYTAHNAPNTAFDKYELRGEPSGDPDAEFPWVSWWDVHNKHGVRRD